MAFTRASAATMFGPDGVLRTAPHNMLRNSSMVGAAAGTPGTLPTNWMFVQGTTGLSYQVVGTATENGVPCVDVRFFGTAQASSSFSLRFEASNVIAALSGQTWALSAYARVVNGSLAGISASTLQFVENTSAGAYLTGGSTTIALNNTLQRFSATRLLNGSTTAYLAGGIAASVVSGQAIDVTLRVGLPQLELNPSVSPIAVQTSTAAAYGPRIDYDPVTLACRGLLIEEQRVNYIRNNTMAGAVAGSPGTTPNGWSTLGTVDGIARSVVNVGTENGIPFVDLQFQGTITNGGAASFLFFETALNTSASSGQAWTESAYMKLVAGDFTNVAAFQLNARTYQADGTTLVDNGATDIRASLTGTLQRLAFTLPSAGANTACISPGIRLLTGTAGQPVNFTLRVGLPQLEQGGFATSPILTTGSQVTRAAESATMALGSWFNQSEGTLDYEVAVTMPAAQQAAAIVFGGVSNGTFGESMYIVRATDGSASTAVVDDGTGKFLGAPAGSFSGVGTVKAALAYKAGDYAGCVNGAVPKTSSYSGLPGPFTTMTFGCAPWGGLGNIVNGHIRRLRYWPQRLNNSLLQQLTA